MAFPYVPAYFLLTNLLTLPLSSVVMGLSVATVVLSGMGCCPAGLVRLTDAAVGLLLGMVRTVSSL